MKNIIMSNMTSRATTTHTCTLLAFLLLSVGAFSVLLPKPATADSSVCPITIEESADVMTLAHNDKIEFSKFSVDEGNNALIIVTNNTDCVFSLSLAAYKVYDRQPSTQKLFDNQNKVIPPHSSRSLLVDLPSCMSQIDLYHDPNRDGPPTPPTYANSKLIGWTFQFNSQDVPAENDMFHFDEGHPYNELDRFPGDDDDGFSNVPKENRCSNLTPLQAQCSVSTDTAKPDETVTWSSQVSGGSGEYDYEWTGDVSGNARSVTKTYTATGTKQSTVTIKDSAGNERSAQCEVTISADNVKVQNGDGGFSLSLADPFAWLVSNSGLRSTKAELNLDSYGGFNKEVTLTAASLNFIDNANTKFVHNNGTPKETVTLQPEDFSDPLEIYVRDSIDAATYPVTITAKADGMSAKQKPLMLYVRSVAEF